MSNGPRTKSSNFGAIIQAGPQIQGRDFQGQGQGLDIQGQRTTILLEQVSKSLSSQHTFKQTVTRCRGHTSRTKMSVTSGKNSNNCP